MTNHLNFRNPKSPSPLERDLGREFALLFLNGIPPENLPKTEGYSVIACTDGAFHYLKEMNFPLFELDFISGDFDSHSGKDDNLYQEKFIYTPDQNKTDFHKALEILIEKNISGVDIYGGSGGEMDHFLGNLSVAFLFKEKLKITFYDESSKYFFSPKHLVLRQVKTKMVSLYPFPVTENITTDGLEWELDGEDLNLQSRIGTRNRAVSEDVEIKFESGELVVFIHH